MSEITIDEARTIIAKTLAKGREMGLKPLSVVVLDSGGHVKAFEREDGASALRFELAHGKAFGAIGLGLGSRALMTRSETQAYFTTQVGAAFGGRLVAVPGGVLVKRDGRIVGAVGVTGDTSDNDEAAAMAGIEAAGLVGDGG